MSELHFYVGNVDILFNFYVGNSDIPVHFRGFRGLFP